MADVEQIRVHSIRKSPNAKTSVAECFSHVQSFLGEIQRSIPRTERPRTLQNEKHRLGTLAKVIVPTQKVLLLLSQLSRTGLACETKNLASCADCETPIQLTDLVNRLNAADDEGFDVLLLNWTIHRHIRKSHTTGCSFSESVEVESRSSSAKNFVNVAFATPCENEDDQSGDLTDAYDYKQELQDLIKRLQPSSETRVIAIRVKLTLTHRMENEVTVAYASFYNRSPLLKYFLAPVQSTLSSETYQDVRARSREVRYERNRQDNQEQEAILHCSEYARWRSFFDDLIDKQSCSTTASPNDTYVNWGRSMLLAFYLAKLGLYFAPKSSQNGTLRDKVRCAFCKRGKMGWWLYPYRESLCLISQRASDLDVAISMWKWHRSKSPTCPYILDLAVDSKFCSQSELLEITRFLQLKFVPDKISLAESCISIPNRSSSSVPMSADSGYSSQSSISRSSASSPSNLWPLFEKADVSVCKDETSAAYEEILHSPANPIDESSLEYEPFVVSNLTEHQWMDSNHQPIEYGLTTPMFSQRIDELLKQPFSYPSLISESVRETTFHRAVNTSQSEIAGQTNDEFYTVECLDQTDLTLGNDVWSPENPSPKKLAAAGFFTTLNGSEILCYACRLQLTQWQVGDDFWIEHAHRSPTCIHVLVNRGASFIREVQGRYDNRNSSASWVVGAYSDICGFFPTISRRVEPRDYRARPEVRLSRAICEECDLEPSLFAYAFELEMRRSGTDFANLVELLEAVKELETRMRLSAINVHRDMVQRCNAEMDALARGTHPSQLAARSTAEQEGAGSTSGMSGTDNSQRTGDDDERRARCTVCLDQALEVAFVPCGHLATCYDCSVRLNDCPVCRTAIRGTLRVRM